MDIRRILQSIQARKWLFLSALLLSLALVVVLPQATNRQYYLSTARILVTPPSQSAVSGPDGRGPVVSSDRWLTNEATLKEIVTSERLVARVLQIAKRNENWAEMKDHVLLEPLSEGFAQEVTLFSLGFEDPDPVGSKKLTETLAQEFVNYVEELSAREFANTRRFLEELVAEAKEKVDATEDKLLSITSAHVSKDETESIKDNTDELESERRKLKEDLVELETELNAVNTYLNGASDAAPWAVIAQGDSSLKQLESAVSDAKLKLLELEQLYTEESQLVRSQRAKLAKIQGVYEARLGSYVQALRNEKAQAVSDRRNRLASLDERVKQLRSRQLSVSERRDVAKLERQLAMWEENYLGLVKQLYQARIMEQSSRRQGAITIIQAPYEGQPVKGKKRRNLAQALGFGMPFSLALAIGVVLMADFFQASMRILPRIESKLEVPVLAVIPTVPPEVAEVWESYKREETMPKGPPPVELITTSRN